MSESLWKDSVKMPEFKSPEGTLNTEVLIVGGGPKKDNPNCIFQVGDAFGFFFLYEKLDEYS